MVIFKLQLMVTRLFLTLILWIIMPFVDIADRYIVGITNNVAFATKYIVSKISDIIS